MVIDFGRRSVYHSVFRGELKGLSPSVNISPLSELFVVYYVKVNCAYYIELVANDNNTIIIFVIIYR